VELENVYVNIMNYSHWILSCHLVRLD